MKLVARTNRNWSNDLCIRIPGTSAVHNNGNRSRSVGSGTPDQNRISPGQTTPNLMNQNDHWNHFGSRSGSGCFITPSSSHQVVEINGSFHEDNFRCARTSTLRTRKNGTVKPPQLSKLYTNNVSEASGLATAGIIKNDSAFSWRGEERKQQQRVVAPLGENNPVPVLLPTSPLSLDLNSYKTGFQSCQIGFSSLPGTTNRFEPYSRPKEVINADGFSIADTLAAAVYQQLLVVGSLDKRLEIEKSKLAMLLSQLQRENSLNSS